MTDPVYHSYLKRQSFLNVALHEAAHCIAAMTFGLPVSRAWADRSGGGAVEAEFDDLPAGENIIASLAGRAAVVALSADPDGLCDDASDSDLAALSGLTMADRRRWHDRAVSFCQEHAEEIIALAEMLLERGEMRGPDFAALCWGVPGPLSKYKELYPQPKPKRQSAASETDGVRSFCRERLFENVLSGRAKLPKGMTASQVIDRVRQARR